MGQSSPLPTAYSRFAPATLSALVVDRYTLDENDGYFDRAIGKLRTLEDTLLKTL